MPSIPNDFAEVVMTTGRRLRSDRFPIGRSPWAIVSCYAQELARLGSRIDVPHLDIMVTHILYFAHVHIGDRVIHNRPPSDPCMVDERKIYGMSAAPMDEEKAHIVGIFANYPESKLVATPRALADAP